MGAVLAVVVVCASAAVARAAGPLPFEIENARTGGLTVSVPTMEGGGGEWEQVVRVVVAGDGGEQATAGLQAVLGPLATAAGMRDDADAKLHYANFAEPLPPKLVPGAGIALTLHAVFPAAGSYKGELLLLAGATQRVVPVTIEVADPVLPAAPLDEHGKAAIALTQSLTGSASPTAELELRNTGAHRLLLGAPEVVSARRVDKVDAPTRDFQVVGVKLRDPEEHYLDPGETKPIPVAMTGLGGPGIYRVEVLVPITAHAPKTFTVTVYRRRHYLWALFWIALGVGVAYFVKYMVEGGSARLKARRTLIAARPRLEAVRNQAHDPAHVGAAIMLAVDLGRIERDVRWHRDGDKLLAAAERLDARVQLLDEIVAAALVVARMEPPPQVELRKTLDEVLAKVKLDSDKIEEVTAARGKVAGLMVDEAWRRQLSAGVAELTSAISALARTGGAAETPGRLAEEIQPKLDGARAKLTATDLEGCKQALDEARAPFLTIAIDDLDQRVEVRPLGPPGYDQEWPAIAADVRAHLAIARGSDDWTTSRGEFVAAQRAYFKAAIAALAGYARDRLADTAHPGDRDALARLADRLDVDKLAVGDALDAAAERYAVTRAQVEAAARPRGPATEGISSVTRSGMLAAFVSVLSEIGERPDGPKTKELTKADAAIRWTDFLVMAAVFIVALASGMKALWTDNLAWGAASEWLTAFLWGAGVGAIGNAFTGLVGLREKLGGPSPLG